LGLRPNVKNQQKKKLPPKRSNPSEKKKKGSPGRREKKKLFSVNGGVNSTPSAQKKWARGVLKAKSLVEGGGKDVGK